MKTKPKAKNTYETTREPNLLRNSLSGRFYGRFFVSGKLNWLNLDTDSFSVAKLRLADERAKIERTRLAYANVEGGTANMGELVRLYRAKLAGKIGIGEKTRLRYLQSVDTLCKTWPGFTELAPAKIIKDEVEKWRNRINREGTGYVLPGAKKSSERCDGRSASAINKCIDALRLVLGIAVDRGQLAGNPLAGRGVKLKQNSKKSDLPDASTLTRIFDEIEKGSGNAKGPDAADFCRFLAFTGCRLNEARKVTWADVDFGRGVIRVRGTKTKAADREVPMIPASRVLLECILAAQKLNATAIQGGEPYVDSKSRLLAVGEAAKSLSRACGVVGAPVLTHHDLRDAFATSCIEAGVDIPTVAAWLGHKDGGALLMRVYAHHRRPHSLAQAAKVLVGM